LLPKSISVTIGRCANLVELKDIKQVETLSRIVIQNCNNITGIDVSGMPNLQYYNSAGCKLLSHINFSNTPKLTELNCSFATYKGGALKSIDVTGCTSLKKLNCSFNVLENIFGLNSCTNLLYLFCQINNLKELDLSACTKLKQILAQGGLSMASVDFSNNTEITSITCSQNGALQEVKGLENCVNLKTFYCSTSNLQDIHFGGNLNQLTTIDINLNRNLKSITGLNGCPALKSLNFRSV
jgi:hypothetical protein